MDNRQDFLDAPQFDKSEVNREMAKELSAKGRDLIELLETNFPTNYPDANAKIHPDVAITVLAPPNDNVSIWAYNQPMRGLGAFADHISFSYSPDKSSIDYDFLPGKRVKTNWEISTSTHTDRRTMEAVEAEMEKDENVKRAVSTYYYFDEEGNCKKLIHIPRSIEDKRPSERSVDGRMKNVEAEMDPGDFELAAFILERFKKLINEAIQLKNPSSTNPDSESQG